MSLDKGFFVFVCLSCLFSTACVGPIQTTIARREALREIDKTTSKKSYVNGCYEYYRAKLLIEKSQEEEAYSDFQAARDFARKATKLAKKANVVEQAKASKPNVFTCTTHEKMRKKYKQAYGYPYFFEKKTKKKAAGSVKKDAAKKAATPTKAATKAKPTKTKVEKPKTKKK